VWSDRETAQDCLGYRTYVEVLAKICTHADLAPLTLGIFGPWGSGKTSLMQMVQVHIEATKGESNWKTIWFNAWMYEGREEAQTALIHTILNLVEEGLTLAGEAKQLWDKLKKGASVLKLSKVIMKSALTLTPDINGFIDAFKDESSEVVATMESYEKDLKRLFALVKVDRIVVFIDDLDRCSSAKVIETFETIKLFLNTPSCTFVIGADADRIKQAVGEVYNVADAQRQKDYLEKIVQIPFSIPAQNVRDIGCYIGMLIVSRHLGDESKAELLSSRSEFYSSSGDLAKAFVTWTRNKKFAIGDETETVIQELQAILPYVDVIAHGLRGNPRQIKRFLNILSLRQQLAAVNKLDLRSDLLLKFTVLEYVWDSFFTALGETIDPRSGKSELLEELVAAGGGKKPSEDSELLSRFLKEPGLTEFLLAEPKLDEHTNVEPYLFLAQTSLSRSQTVGLATLDEKTKQLVRTIEGSDRILSRSAARQAAQEPSVATSVVRQLSSDLTHAKDPVATVNMLAAIEVIGTSHPQLFKTPLKSMVGIDGSNPAVSLAASTFINAAEKAGTEIPKTLQEKFAQGSKIASALKPRANAMKRSQ